MTAALPTPVTVKLDLKMEVGVHPKDHVLAVEYFVKHLCKTGGKDAGEATMMLLVAAVHLAIVHSKRAPQEVITGLGTALGHAIGTALGWWPIKEPEKKTILHS
jgi:hypothetical protein